MLNNIPFNRAIFYVMALSFLPAICVCLYLISSLQTMQIVERRIDEVELHAKEQERRQATNVTVMNHFRDADHFYIDKHLEVLSFLEPEIEALQKITTHKNFTDDPAIKKRLDLLTGPGNALHFSEGVVQKFPQFQETTETLIHPIEVNVQDIQKILALVEGVKIGSFSPAPYRPQLIILDFKIEKKKTIDQNEAYVLNLKLLKREYQ